MQTRQRRDSEVTKGRDICGRDGNVAPEAAEDTLVPMSDSEAMQDARAILRRPKCVMCHRLVCECGSSL